MCKNTTFRPGTGPVVALALVARLIALVWNDRLFGDVNLYALVARHWVETGRLDYPLKLDYFDSAPYLALSTPVTQHPPAWSWLAGLLVKYAALPDAFAALKLLSLAAGLLVVVLGMAITRVLAGDRAAFWAGLLLALHPLLIDFSANGSPYIAVAAGALAVVWAVLSTDATVWKRSTAAAIGAAVAWNFHGVGLLLMPAGLLGLTFTATPATRPRLLAGYVLILGVFITPLITWNYLQFGTFTQSNSTFYLFGNLGLIHLADDPAGLHNVVGQLTWAHLLPYLSLALGSSLRLTLHLALETGFVGLLLAGVGIIALAKPDTRVRTFAALLVLFALAAPCLGWPQFKYRFLVLLIPFAIIFAVVGTAHLRNLHPPRLVTTGALTAVAGCLIFWIVQIGLTGAPAKYYAYDLKHLGDYRLMRSAAHFLENQPPGVVLTLPRQLDGGIETVWWTRQPTVLARGFPDRHLTRLIADFKPSYLLASAADASRLQNLAPQARPAFQNAGYCIYTLPASPRFSPLGQP
jgi:hypothetical protein